MKIRGIAHRGYSAKYPENTMSAFRAAIRLGFTHMELDVHVSKDGVPVVMHDSTLDRMTNGTGEIRQYTLNEFKTFTINKHERIPTLEEVLTLAKDQIIVSIELKNPDLYVNVEEKVFDVIQKLGMIDQVYIISFNYKSLEKMREISKDIKLGPLTNGIKRSHVRLLQELDAEYFAVKHTSLKEKHIRKCEELGIQLVVWTVNSMEEMKKTCQHSSILVTTDELEIYKSIYIKEDRQLNFVEI